MGGAAAGLPQDAPSLFMNPAGLAGLKTGEFAVMYDKMYAGLSGAASMAQSYMSVAYPTALGTFGAGLGTFKASGLMEERTFAVGFARALGRFQAGGTGKYLDRRFSLGDDVRDTRDPVFSNGTSKGAFALDLGLTAAVAGPLRAGLSARNLNRPDVGLVTEDRVPRELQFGLGLELRELGLKLLGDLSHRDNGFGDAADRMIPRLGVEKSLSREKVFFRLGANTLEFTAGAGVRLGRFGFDYALALRRSLLRDNMGSHRLGLTLQFGGTLPSQAAPRKGWEAFRPGTSWTETKLAAARQAIYDARYDSALERIREVLTVDAANARALELAGSVHHLKGEPDRAREAWEKALKLEPHNQAVAASLKRMARKTRERIP